MTVFYVFYCSCYLIILVAWCIERGVSFAVWLCLKDKRNFLRNPPAGVQFHFDYEAIFPIAMVMLEEDQDLKELRFKIVPKE